MLERLRNRKKDIDAVEKETIEPIDKKEVEKAIKLIEAAHNIDCYFKVHFNLIGSGEFIVVSDSFKGIKMVNSKKEGNRVLIQYATMLFASDTYINLENIINIVVECKYESNQGDINV